MEAADKWHVPPFKIFGGSKVLWFARFTALRNAEVEREKKLERERKLRELQGGK